ncbi:MAG TPA: N-acetylmuramoyl-L-alanine amidase [Actinomycetota bacterium]|nr:N-acetylmuramoyl-L-alanine amidase [Actinomycetota bacterium]
MRTYRFLPLAVVLALGAVLVPGPALSLSAPRTLAVAVSLGDLTGRSGVVDPPFPVDFVGISWTSGGEPSMRLRADDGTWKPWTVAHEEEIPANDGATFSRLVEASDADAFQVRGRNRDVRVAAINTTDGPRSPVWSWGQAQAAHIAQPPVISRAAWGADESYRFRADGTEKSPPVFFPTQKLIVHHTVTANADPDPAATVRAIYRYHAIDRGWGDIGYNFLVDANGQIYKGRYSGPPGTTTADTSTGEDASGNGVRGAHTAGSNSGTMGIAVLGTYSSTPVPVPARSALIEHLAWESERHGLDPLATTTFVNPSDGSRKTVANISGHRDWRATQCPGGALYADLPAIRQETAARIGSGGTPLVADHRAPRISKVKTASVRRLSAVVRWSTSEPADSQVQYWTRGKPRRETDLQARLVTAHRTRLKRLKPDTTYGFRVRSADQAGNPTWRKGRPFQTDGG